MKCYVLFHGQGGGAGSWIYEGYFSAWKALGFDVEYYSDVLEVKAPKEYIVMATEGALNHTNPQTLKFLEGASKVFMFVQPHKFPDKWGTHPNFVSKAPDSFVQEINSMKNVHLWSFANTSGVDFWDKWKTINYVPLAFDSINYEAEKDDIFKYDVCYVGGVANNGFDEKKVIMRDYFTELETLGVSLGIFINCGISRQEEANVLHNSLITLNIHDKYQHVLGLDCNERTFKSLGLNGILISKYFSISNLCQAGNGKSSKS